MDLDEEYEKLDALEVKILEQNEEVKKIISTQNSASKTITFGGVEIKIRAYMPRAVRLKIMKAGNDLKSVKTEKELRAIEKRLYPIISEMCMEKPYTDPKTWHVIDVKTSAIQEVLFKIVSEVTQTDEAIKSFRNKQ